MEPPARKMSSVVSVQRTEMSTLDTWSMSGAIRVACCTFAVGDMPAAHAHDHMRLGSNVAAATACAAGMEIGGTQAERVCRGARPRRSRCTLCRPCKLMALAHAQVATSPRVGRVGAPIVCSVAVGPSFFFVGRRNHQKIQAFLLPHYSGGPPACADWVAPQPTGGM